jgi:hypothetical protein
MIQQSIHMTFWKWTKDLNKLFSKADTWMANSTCKAGRCHDLTQGNVRGNQDESHFTPATMLFPKKG